MTVSLLIGCMIPANDRIILLQVLIVFVALLLVVLLSSSLQVGDLFSKLFPLVALVFFQSVKPGLFFRQQFLSLLLRSLYISLQLFYKSRESGRLRQGFLLLFFQLIQGVFYQYKTLGHLRQLITLRTA